jgi:hypothetical protein
MTLLDVFQSVAAGRIEACGDHLWICPTCSWRIGYSPDPAIRDRLAMDHCLSHVYTFSRGCILPS